MQPGTEARIGVAGAGGISRTDWAGVEGTKSSMGRKGEGEGEALRVDIGVGAGEDELLGGLPGRDSIHDKRLFRCAGNAVLRLLAPFLLLLLFDDCKEGEAYRAGASSGTLPSIDLWMFTDLLEACDAAMLCSSPKIGSSISPKFKKQERWDSSSLILSSSALAAVCKPDICKAFAAPASFVVSSTSPPPASSVCSAARIPSKISAISASRSACSVSVSCSLV
jgi:hypothetical protein